MKLMSLFTYHSHYWGIPHARETDNRLVQTCYECGAEREVRIELRESQEQPLSSHPGDQLVA